MSFSLLVADSRIITAAKRRHQWVDIYARPGHGPWEYQLGTRSNPTSTLLRPNSPAPKANILIDDHSHARLTCLNRLTIVSEDSAIRSVRHPTKALDCFALGMVIGEVLRGQELPPQYTSPSAVGVVDAERPQGAEWARFTEKIWRTLELCWGFHPDDQISAKGILLGLE